MMGDEEIGTTALQALAKVLEEADPEMAKFLRNGEQVIPATARETGASSMADHLSTPLLRDVFKLAHQRAYTHLDGLLLKQHCDWNRERRLSHIAANHPNWFSPSLAAKNDQRLRDRPTKYANLLDTAFAANEAKAQRVPSLPEDSTTAEMEEVMRENRRRAANGMLPITVADLRRTR